MQPHFAEMLKMLESGLFIMFSVYFIFSSLVCLHTGVYSVFLVQVVLGVGPVHVFLSNLCVFPSVFSQLGQSCLDVCLVARFSSHGPHFSSLCFLGFVCLRATIPRFSLTVSCPMFHVHVYVPLSCQFMLSLFPPVVCFLICPCVYLCQRHPLPCVVMFISLVLMFSQFCFCIRTSSNKAVFELFCLLSLHFGFNSLLS